MPKPRKIRVPNEENEIPKEAKKKNNSKETPAKKQKYEPAWMRGDGRTVVNLILSIQKSDVNNTKVLVELTKLYKSMGHEGFMAVFSKMISVFLIRDEADEYAARGLKFLGTFIASFGEEVAEDGGSHPIISETFAEILEISSKQYHVRSRICILVTHIMCSFSQRAEIDETIMDGIIDRMTSTFIRDVSPVVRQHAIMALQRLQDPENSEDQVTRAYIYHMETDPVGKVRQAAITAIAKKLPVITYIIDRLQDSDEKVRRHTYMQIASYPVKSYKIADRIKIMAAGLNDRSDMVKKTVNNILLLNWIHAYDNDYTEFCKAIKLDSSDCELIKFRALGQDVLTAIFKKRKISDLIAFLQLTDNKCLTVDKANTLEWLVMWKVVLKMHLEVKTVESGDEKSDDDEAEPVLNVNIMPELSVLCEYVEKFTTEFKNPTGTEAKYQKLSFNHCVITLLEIVQLNDFSDVIGCEKVKAMIKAILLEHEVNEHCIKEIAQVVEQVIPTVEARLAFFNAIVVEMVKPGGPSEYSRKTIIDDLIGKADLDTQVKANSLKMEMMELKEKENAFVEKKQYGNAQQVTEMFAARNEALIELLRPFTEDSNSTSQTLTSLENLSSVVVSKKITPADILKNIRICFFAMMMKGVKAMTHDCMNIYNEFICYHLESSDTVTRVWALKTATAYSMLYESLAKDVYVVLKSQMFKSNNVMIWEVTIGCIVDLLLRYSVQKMEQRDDSQDMNGTGGTQSRSKKGGRMLYTDDSEDAEDEDIVGSIDTIQMLTHVLDNNIDLKVHKATMIGFCKLILHGQYCTRELMSKFLLAFFNPATEPEINQILGIFFESIIRMKKQESLHDALIPTLVTLFEAPSDSPLKEVKQETVLKYVIGATRPVFCSNGLNLHNTLGLKLLELMGENLESREIHRVFAKELLLLEIGDDPLLKKDMVKKIDALLAGIKVDLRTRKNIVDFSDMLKGCYKVPLKFSSTAMTTGMESDVAGESDDEEEQKISMDEVMDINMSAVELKELDVNVTKLEMSKVQEEDDTMGEKEPGEESIVSADTSRGSANASRSLNVTQNTSRLTRKSADSSRVVGSSRSTAGASRVGVNASQVSNTLDNSRISGDDSRMSGDDSRVSSVTKNTTNTSRLTRRNVEASQSSIATHDTLDNSCVSNKDSNSTSESTDDTQVPETQDPAAASTQDTVSSFHTSLDIPATQSEDSEDSGASESSDEANETVKSVAVEDSSEETVPATPETPARPKRNVTNKRQLEISQSVNSPLRKQQKSDESAPTTPKTPKAQSTMMSPKTPRFSALPLSKASTPNTDRQTRKQARDEVATTSTLTRSASRKMKVDPVEIAEKIVKAAEVPAKKAVKETSAPQAATRQTRGNVGKAKSTAKDVKPRWR